MWNLDTANDEVSSFCQLMDIIAHSDTKIHLVCVFSYLRLKRSLRPSMSNVNEKRNVWSSGLLFVVAMR